MKFNYIFCKTVSGEGYSSPEFKILSTKAEAIRKFQREISELLKQGYFVGHKTSAYDWIGEDKSDNPDYHRLRIIEVAAHPFYLIYYTEPNEVKVIGKYYRKLFALHTMNKKIAAINWDKAEETYQGEMEYGAHTDDAFKYFAVIGLNAIGTLKESATRKKKNYMNVFKNA